MSLTHTTATRNTLSDAIDTLVNAAGAGTIAIYDSGDVSLASIALSTTAFGASASGTITLAGVPLSNTAAATGTASYFRINENGGTEILRGSVTVTGGGGDIVLDSVSITSGQTVTITGFTYSASA